MADDERPPVEQEGKPERAGDHAVPDGFLDEFEAKERERARKRAKS